MTDNNNMMQTIKSPIDLMSHILIPIMHPFIKYKKYEKFMYMHLSLD